MGRHGRVLRGSQRRGVADSVCEERGCDVGVDWVRRRWCVLFTFSDKQRRLLTKADIDWEYPGGNGQDYKKIPNSEKKWEIEAYPLFLEAIRKALPKDKALSIAVPGKKVDMIAYTKEQGPKIWPSVDFVNVMSYDMMNRRNNVTTHHSSVRRSLETINNYAEIGLGGDKMNLGIAYYAKWFTTVPDANCDTQPLGCDVVPLENPDGTGNGKSGVVTFEKGNMGPPPENIKVSTDGTCGLGKGRCPGEQCCSQYGNW